jgi:FkbM family methyltransferase
MTSKEFLGFIDRIIDAEADALPRPEKLKDPSRRNIIFGAGVYAYVLCEHLIQLGIPIAGFAVNSEFCTSDSYMDMPLFSLEKLDGEKNSIRLILGVAHHPPVAAKLKILGFEIHAIDVPDFLNPGKKFLDSAFLESEKERLVEVFCGLEDELSKRTFCLFLEAKLMQDPSVLEPVVQMDHLYFPSNEFQLGNREVLVDVGGFDGDSLRDFHRITKGNYSRIFSFEPFAESYEKLRKTVHALGSERIEIYSCAVWSEETKLKLGTTKYFIDNKIDPDGKLEVEAYPLDDLLADRNCRITRMKLDINGAELAALQGAAKIIRSDRPTIATKVQTAADVIAVPTLLKTISSKQSIYLRQRTSVSMNLVLYSNCEVEERWKP